MTKEKVAQAIWAELERQAKNVDGPLIISGTGIIDGFVDMDSVAEVAIQAAKGLTQLDDQGNCVIKDPGTYKGRHGVGERLPMISGLEVLWPDFDWWQ